MGSLPWCWWLEEFGGYVCEGGGGVRNVHVIYECK